MYSFVNSYESGSLSFALLYLCKKLIMRQSKSCLQCGVTIQGRSDKKFCSDYCRNFYNNFLNRETKQIIRNTNNRLRKNFKILSDCNTSGKTKISRRKLFDKGFDFSAITSVYITKTDKIYYYVYSQGYLELNNDWYLLVEQE